MQINIYSSLESASYLKGVSVQSVNAVFLSRLSVLCCLSVPSVCTVYLCCLSVLSVWAVCLCFLSQLFACLYDARPSSGACPSCTLPVYLTKVVHVLAIAIWG